MEQTNMNTVSIHKIHQWAGGQCTEKGDLLVLKNTTINTEVINRPFRAQESFAIIFCERGRCELSVNMQARMLSPGSIMMYGRDNIVEFGNIEGQLILWAIVLHSDFLGETTIDLRSVMPILQYFTENTASMLSLDEQEVNLLKKFFDIAYDIVEMGNKVIIGDILAGLIRLLGEMYRKRLSENPPRLSRQEEYFEKFLKQLSKNHMKERSVKFYADALHITPKYLSSVIKEVSGRSAASWINDFVIQQAKINLKLSGKSIQEITYMMNFSTQSFFGKYFKRHTGLSPSEYRQQE